MKKVYLKRRDLNKDLIHYIFYKSEPDHKTRYKRNLEYLKNIKIIKMIDDHFQEHPTKFKHDTLARIYFIGDINRFCKANGVEEYKDLDDSILTLFKLQVLK